MCDCAEELERRERAQAEELANAMAALRASSGQPSLFGRLFGFLGGFGEGGGWFPFVGGTALLVGLLGFLYKNFGDRFNLKMLLGGKRGKSDPCEGSSEPKKPPPPPQPMVPCHCNS